MKRRLIAMAGATAGAGALVLGTMVGSAAAKAPDAQGWWSEGNNSALPVGLPAPPNVPSDGLYVASDSTGAEAIAAVRFTVPEGASTGPLTLKIAPNGLGTPTVALCRTTGPWQAAQGGAWDQKPAFDGNACSNGTVAADGQSVTFATSALISGGLLNAAVVPVKDASGNQPTFQMALNKPADDALTVTEASSSSDAAASSGASTASSPAVSSSSSSASAPATSSSGGSGLSSSSRSSSGSYAPVSVAPAATEQSAAVSQGPAQGSSLVTSPSGVAAPRAAARPVVATAKDNTRKYRIVAILGLIVLACVYTALNERPARTAKALVAFGQQADDDGGTDGFPEGAGA